MLCLPMTITGSCITNGGHLRYDGDHSRARPQITQINVDFRFVESLIQEDFVHIAPAPVFARLERLHDGMLGLVKVLGGVLILG